MPLLQLMPLLPMLPWPTQQFDPDERGRASDPCPAGLLHFLTAGENAAKWISAIRSHLRQEY